MPAVDRDYYNRQTLADQLTAAKAAQAQADALKNQHPDWAAGHEPNIRTPGNCVFGGIQGERMGVGFRR